MAADPSINVCVYVVQDEDVDVQVCECDLNPIHVRIGGKYRTNATNMFLSLAKAEELLHALRSALTDRFIVANGDDVTVADADQTAPIVRVAE